MRVCVCVPYLICCPPCPHMELCNALTEKTGPGETLEIEPYKSFIPKLCLCTPSVRFQDTGLRCNASDGGKVKLKDIYFGCSCPGPFFFPEIPGSGPNVRRLPVRIWSASDLDGQSDKPRSSISYFRDAPQSCHRQPTHLPNFSPADSWAKDIDECSD